MHADPSSHGAKQPPSSLLNVVQLSLTGFFALALVCGLGAEDPVACWPLAAFLLYSLLSVILKTGWPIPCALLSGVWCMLVPPLNGNIRPQLIAIATGVAVGWVADRSAKASPLARPFPEDIPDQSPEERQAR